MFTKHVSPRGHEREILSAINAANDFPSDWSREEVVVVDARSSYEVNYALGMGEHMLASIVF